MGLFVKGNYYKIVGPLECPNSRPGMKYPSTVLDDGGTGAGGIFGRTNEGVFPFFYGHSGI